MVTRVERRGETPRAGDLKPGVKGQKWDVFQRPAEPRPFKMVLSGGADSLFATRRSTRLSIWKLCVEGRPDGRGGRMDEQASVWARGRSIAVSLLTT